MKSILRTPEEIAALPRYCQAVGCSRRGTNVFGRFVYCAEHYDPVVRKALGLMRSEFVDGLSCIVDEPHVYFIQAGEHAIKIGWTRNADTQERLACLQVGCPHELKVLAKLPGAAHVEKLMHRVFEAALIRGEWFRPTKELIEFIEIINTRGAEAAMAKLRGT